MNGKDFTDWLSNAAAGQSIEYHRSDVERPNRGRSAVMEAAWSALERGEVMLFQKRIAPNIFGYIAAKRGKVKRVVWHGCYDPNRSKYALAA